MVRGDDGVEILDEAQIPPEYLRTKTESAPDKKAIKAALESGLDVPGADLSFGKNALVRR